MWCPTHVQVTVQRAKGLLIKGKHGTNDVFVTIALGREKYQTSVKEKSGPNVEWHEECELLIPKQGNTAEITLTVLHRSFLGLDEFLGITNIPLADFDVYERPKSRWYTLKSKTKKEKERGELELKISFLVKSGSLTNLTRKEKHKSSLGQLSQTTHFIGGSLLSIGSLEGKKGLKKLTKSFGNKISSKHKKKETSSTVNGLGHISHVTSDADPGVISEGDSEDGFTFDELSHKSSGSSLNINSSSTIHVGDSLENLAGGEFMRRTSIMTSADFSRSPNVGTGKNADEWEKKLYGRHVKDIHFKTRSLDGSKISTDNQAKENDNKENTGHQKSLISSQLLNHSQESVKSTHEAWDLHGIKEEEEKDNIMLLRSQTLKQEIYAGIKVSGNSTNDVQTSATGKLGLMPDCPNSTEIFQQFSGQSREELIELVCGLQRTVEHQKKKLTHMEIYLKDLEDYLDNLLLRVMETTPRILQNPYITYKFENKYGC